MSLFAIKLFHFKKYEIKEMLRESASEVFFFFTLNFKLSFYYSLICLFKNYNFIYYYYNRINSTLL